MNFKIVFQNGLKFFNKILQCLSPLSEFHVISLEFSKQKLILTSNFYGKKSETPTIPKYIIEIDLEEKVDQETYNIREEKSETFYIEIKNFRNMITRCNQNDLNQISVFLNDKEVYFKVENSEINNISISYKYSVDIKLGSVFDHLKNFDLEDGKKIYFRSLLKSYFFKNSFDTYEKDIVSLNIYSGNINCYLVEGCEEFFEEDDINCVIFQIENEDKSFSINECMETSELDIGKFSFEFNIEYKFCKNISKLCEKGDYLYVSLNIKKEIIFEIEDEDFYCNVVIPLNLKPELEM